MTDPRGPAAERFLREKANSEGADRPRARPRAEWLEPGSDGIELAYLGWEIARSAPGLDADERRALAAIAGACLAAIRAGSTRLPASGPAFQAALAAVGAEHARDAARALLERAEKAGDPVAAVIGRPGDRKPLVLRGGWLYAERMYALEERLCARIEERVRTGGERLAAPAGGARGPESREAFGERAIVRAVRAAAASARLTREQKAAAAAALRSRLTLVLGGPGTGKTTTVVAIVRAVAWLGLPLEAIAVAAPTGKAAQRISDGIAEGLRRAPGDVSDAQLRAFVPSPMTLHRLLGWSPRTGRFAHHENDPLSHRLVIVDEASMIDVTLMDRLVRALRTDCRLVLVGDADQLPSVEAGAVFRDLCAALGGARLSTNLRVASDSNARGLVAAAEAVNAGTLGPRFDACVVRRRAAREVEFEGVEHLDRAWSEIGEDLLERWWARIGDDSFVRRVSRTYRAAGGRIEAPDAAELGELFAQHARARILCVTRIGDLPTSTEAVNRRMLRRLRESSPPALRRGGPIAIGAPFIVERNDYSRGLYNGDQGVVVRGEAAAGEFKVAAFARSDGFDALPVEALDDLAPAFAMTVHKAQGSEFDHVVLVLPENDIPLLTRELVYTAITRARRSALIVGGAEVLARAVGRTTTRYSGIAERLGARTRDERPAHEVEK